jgi:FtsZ-binding cell division protein ZapB
LELKININFLEFNNLKFKLMSYILSQSKNHSTSIPNYRSYRQTSSSSPDIISNLKLQVFEKTQRKPNYSNLLSQYNKLKDDYNNIIKMKKELDLILINHNSKSDQSIKEIKDKNEILCIKLNEQISINQNLYNENNYLYKDIGQRKEQNRKLQEEIKKQQEILNQMSFEKDEYQKNIYNLSLREKEQEIQIQNYKQDIHKLNCVNETTNSIIMSRSGKNIDVNNLISDEKTKKENLLNELKIKENEIKINEQNLKIVNQKLYELKTNMDKINLLIQQQNENINSMNNIETLESTSISKILNDNKNINDNIYNLEENIKLIEKEINELKEGNKGLNTENINLYNIIPKYQKNIEMLKLQNKNLSSEVQLILGRDMEMKLILERTGSLKKIKEDNSNIINESLEQIRQDNINDNCFISKNYKYKSEKIDGIKYIKKNIFSSIKDYKIKTSNSFDKCIKIDNNIDYI